MTYCVAIAIDEGLIFASDSRTSAGVDDLRVYSKMHVYEYPGERVVVMLSAGNLATAQAVLQHIQAEIEDDPTNCPVRSSRTLYDFVQHVGQLSVEARKKSAEHVSDAGVDLGATFIVGGQIAGREPRLYLVYPLGNSISVSRQTPFLQIGESKYGKPILDRIIRPDTRLEDAARCALVSMDSTMRSNASVGPPLELVLLRRDSARVDVRMKLETDSPYLVRLRSEWARQLESVFAQLPRFDWEADPERVFSAR